MNREAIYGALWAKVSSAAGLVLTSRRLRHFGDLSPAQMPALFMQQRRETPTNTKTGLPLEYVFEVALFLYVHAGEDPNAVPVPTINALIDAVLATLAGNVMDSAQTLGGLVHYCRQQGSIEIEEGWAGNVAIVMIPIEIMAPA